MEKSKEFLPSIKINLTSRPQWMEGQVKQFQEIYNSTPSPESLDPLSKELWKPGQVLPPDNETNLL